MSTRQRLQVPCSVELANTRDDCYAHVVLQGIDVGPGDEVLVHDAPTAIAWGERRVCRTRATVSRASWFGRFWTRLTARFELSLLYEVSFSSARFAGARTPYPRATRGPSPPADRANVQVHVHDKARARADQSQGASA